MDDEILPSTSRGPLAKKRRTSATSSRKYYSDDDIARWLLENLEGSDDELDLIVCESGSEADSENEAVDIDSTETPDVLQTAEEESGDLVQPLLPQMSSKWLSDRPSIPAMKFTGGIGLKVNVPQPTPVGFFNLFFTPNFYKFLADEANDYAKYVLFESKGSKSRICEWKEVTIEDMKTFIGEIFLMGIIRLNRLNDCWKTHYLYNLPFPKFMSRDRFLLILRCLHFDRERTSNDPISKIRPFMDYFNKKMDELCYSSRELTIDASMVLWRGILQWKQFIKNKRHKFGMKLYVLAEPNGLVQHIHVYGGSIDMEVGGEGHAKKVVNKLMTGKEGKGHALFMDNYYNSISLTEELLKNQTYCTGTLQPNRKGNPKEVISKKLQKGETFCCYTEEGIACCKWRDKRDVLSLSSEFGADMVSTKNKRGQTKIKPKLIVEYNSKMRGVDHQDQMLAYYPVTHKTLCWYKKLAIHLLHLMLNNSYLLYNKYSNEKKIDLHDFHIMITSYLLPEPAPKITVSDAIHLPEFLPKASNNKTQRKRCKLCSEKLKIRKDSIFGCPQCPGFPGFCLAPCFRKFHGYQ